MNIKSNTSVTIKMEQLFIESNCITYDDFRKADTVGILHIISCCWSHQLIKYRVGRNGKARFVRVNLR